MGRWVAFGLFWLACNSIFCVGRLQSVCKVQFACDSVISIDNYKWPVYGDKIDLGHKKLKAYLSLIMSTDVHYRWLPRWLAHREEELKLVRAWFSVLMAGFNKEDNMLKWTFQQLLFQRKPWSREIVLSLAWEGKTLYSVKIKTDYCSIQVVWVIWYENKEREALQMRFGRGYDTKCSWLHRTIDSQKACSKLILLLI